MVSPIFACLCPELLEVLHAPCAERRVSAQTAKLTDRTLITSAVIIRARERSGEGVVRRNGCPKGCFWRVHFFSAPLRFALKTSENLKGADKKRTLQKHPFGQPFLLTTPSPSFIEHPHIIQSRSTLFQGEGKLGFFDPETLFCRN